MKKYCFPILIKGLGQTIIEEKNNKILAIYPLFLTK
jgi:hypothetical protein